LEGIQVDMLDLYRKY